MQSQSQCFLSPHFALAGGREKGAQFGPANRARLLKRLNATA
jgi:hypothetical protein